MMFKPAGLALAAALAAASAPAFAQSCKELAAEATRLKAEMAAIGQQAVAASKGQAATQQGMAIGALTAQGLGSVVPMGGLVAQGIVTAQQHQAQGALAASGDRMQQMQAKYARLQQVEALRAAKCGG